MQNPSSYHQHHSMAMTVAADVRGLLQNENVRKGLLSKSKLGFASAFQQSFILLSLKISLKRITLLLHGVWKSQKSLIASEASYVYILNGQK